MTAPIHKTAMFEDSSGTFMCRMLASDGSAAQQADVTSIAYIVYDRTGGASVISGTLTVANVVFDTLQTASPWTLDSTGYNFKATLPTTAFPTGGRLYRVEFKWTFADSTVGIDAYDVKAESVFIS